MRVAVALLFFATWAIFAQDPTLPAPKQEAPEFFSGSVTAMTAKRLTVHRKGLGTNAATKSFDIDSETKVEGKLKLRVMVTIQYLTAEDGTCRAIHIIVR